jgi:hypothetical protein
MPNNDLINEGQVPSNWEPVEVTPSKGSAAPVPHEMPPLFAGSISPNLQHDTSFVGTETNSPRVPKFALMPFGPTANAAINAATKSVIINRSNSSSNSGNPTPAPSGGGGSSQITLNIPPEFTPTTQTVTLPGPLAFTWAVEPPNTVFSGPSANAGGFDASFGTAGGSATSAGVIVTTVSGVASQMPSWALYVGTINGASFTSDPVGWTVLPGHTTTNPIMEKAMTAGVGVTATEGAVTANNASWATNIAIFAGPLPTVYQSAAAGNGGTSIITVPLAPTGAGHALLVILRAATISPVPNGISSTGYTISDTQGLTPVFIADSHTGFQNTFLTNSQSTVWLLPNTIAGAETLTIHVSILVDPIWGAETVIANAEVLEISTTSLVAGIPRFRAPEPIDLSNSQGILPVFSGGTGADLSTTGGPGQFVKQSILGAPFTVGTITAADLAGAGVAVEKATVDLTAQTTALGPTSLINPPLTRMYRLSAYLKVTTVDATSSTLGPLTITYTDGSDSVAQSNIMLMADQTGAAVTSNSGNTTVSTLNGSMVIWVAAGGPIQYSIGYASNVPGTMAYEVHLKLEAM